MKTPVSIIDKFEKAAIGLDYGTVTLSLFLKQGKPRYVIAREESYVPTDEMSVTADSYAIEGNRSHRRI